MNKDTVLIVTNADDPHVDRVMPIINAHGMKCFRFNTETFPTAITATMRVDNGVSGILQDAEGTRLPIERIASVWYRRPIEARPHESITSEIGKNLIVRESREFVENLWFQIDARWISHPYAIRRASRKVEQLKTAAKVGWKIPSTLVTNDVQEVRQFITAHNQVVVKNAV